MACGDCKGCWSLGEVAVGYYPCRLTGATSLFVGPSFNAPVKARVILVAGDWVGVQSTRNAHEVDVPPCRPPRNGFVWVYSARRHHSGWVPQRLIEACPTRGWARGPAGEDFEVGTDPVKRGATGGCNGRRARLRRKRTIGAQEVYLRYAPRSTAFGYLVSGDVVRERYINRRGGFRCVEVVAAEWVPRGTVGWVHESALS